MTDARARGPRRRCLQALLAAVAAPAFVRHAGARSEGARFALGIASGNPTPAGVVLWTRLTGDDLPERVEVQWELAEDEGFTRGLRRGREWAEAAWAHSVHAEPAGLEPGRWYWYRFEALGARSAVGRTRTAPAPDAPATLRAAVASCQRWDHGHYAAWRHVVADAPDLVLFVGDYIYEYPYVPRRVRGHDGGPVYTLSQYRARYAQYKSDPALQAAHAAAPWLLVWDDHEVENDYAGLHSAWPLPGFGARRADAYQACWEHQPFPKAWRPQGADMRIHTRCDWGALARIHLLDGRQYRDPQACPRTLHGGGQTLARAACPEIDDPRRSLLGLEQERWLADGWDLQRRWNLLAQQTLMTRFAVDDPARGASVWTDGWDGYPATRARVLHEAAQRRVENLVVLGGDIHAHVVADLKADFDDPRAPVVATEFCGTSISSLGRPQARFDAARRANPHVHFARGDRRGYLRLNVDEQRLQAELRVLDDALDPASGAATAARFVVEAGRPGAQAG